MMSVPSVGVARVPVNPVLGRTYAGSDLDS
jgi:hypothetical protein